MAEDMFNTRTNTRAAPVIVDPIVKTVIERKYDKLPLKILGPMNW